MFTAINILALLSGCILWEQFWKKKNKPMAELVSTILAVIVLWGFFSPGALVKTHIAGSAALMDFLQVLVIVATIYFMGFVKLEICDYLVMLGALFAVLEWGYVLGYPRSVLIIATWVLLLLMIHRRYEHMVQRMISAFVSALAAFISASLFYIIYDELLRQEYYAFMDYYNPGNVEKILVLSAATIIFMVFIAIIILGVNRSLHIFLERTEKFSEDYAEVGRYFLLVPFVVGIVFFVLDFLRIHLPRENLTLNYTMSILFIAVIIGMQIFYLKMMFSTVQLKEKMEYQDTMQMNLMEYNQRMGENLAEIRAMKHDLKNVFLTMGEYVARSDDKEMQEYYYSNIAPFATNEIHMNDIYVSLHELGNESLKAFLYYKIMQAMDVGVEIQLDTRLDHSYFPYLTQTTDYTRILGIFMDNAVEEVSHMEAPGSMVHIIISEKEGKMSISVRNKLRPETMERGIIKGTTSKGLGRGNGLLNVEQIIRRHSDILWNSYYHEDEYVQTITVEK